MDARTAELRDAHDVLAPFYAERLEGLYEQMPIEQAVLGLFARFVHDAGVGLEVADVGCGTGRMAPHLAALGLQPSGIDLSPEMIRTARRDVPDVPFEVGDLRELPWPDASFGATVGWYSLMYLSPEDRAGAYAELARIVRPGGHLAMAFKVGDDTMRRGGKGLDLGIGFDIWWHSPAAVENLLDAAGFDVIFHAGRPAEPDEPQPQGYVIARRR